MTGDQKSMTYGDYLILLVGQLLTLIPSTEWVCNARQYRLVRIGRPSVRPSVRLADQRVTSRDTRIRFFNLANALHSEIATRRRRRDIVITAVGVTKSSIIHSSHWSSPKLRSRCTFRATAKFDKCKTTIYIPIKSTATRRAEKPRDAVSIYYYWQGTKVDDSTPNFATSVQSGSKTSKLNILQNFGI